MTRIPDKTEGGYSQVENKTMLSVPVADRQAVDVSGHGLPFYFTFEELGRALSYKLLPATSHGHDSSDHGKPLSGTEILDDADLSHSPSSILVEVVNANLLRIAPPGTEITIAVALLEDGNAYDVDALGRYVFWDLSVGTYVAELPVDCLTPAILEIISVGDSSFTACVRSF